MAIGFNHACALTREGSVFCWGKVGFVDPPPGKSRDPEIRHVPLRIRQDDGSLLTNIDLIGASWTTTCGRRLDGRLWCWGQSHLGKLGTLRDPLLFRTAVAELVKGE